MFSGWQTFFQMTAEAAATLTGLVFVVVTLSAGRQGSATQQGLKLFSTPIVFHLASVLVISALALAPAAEGRSPRAIMTLWCAVGLVYGISLTRGLRKLESQYHWSDLWWYGVAPVIAYSILTAAAGAAWAEAPHACYALALAILILLLTAIRDAWDLATFLVQRANEPGPPPPNPEP